MNFFFLTVNEKYSAKLAIPKFQNSGRTDSQLRLYQANIVANKWCISKPDNCTQDEQFWHLHYSGPNNDAIFFLSSELDARLIEEKNQLVNIGKFTDTSPSFRANMMIENSFGGFSSYQAEYPFTMVEKLSSFYSECGLLTSDSSCSAGVFIRNINIEPITEERDLWLFSVPKNKVLDSYKVRLNTTTYIDLTKHKKELNGCFLFAKDFIGVPSYVTEYDDGSLSFEHTHPPHEALLGSNRFQLVSKLKERAFEKVSKTNI
jgi:hypothetical protein